MYKSLNQILDYIYSNHKIFVLGLLLVSIILALASLYHREIAGDDPWFAEQAYWFAKNGYVRSELYHGLLGYEDRHLVYHRLHIWQGALAYKLFGWSVYTFKSITFFYFAMFLVLAYFYFKRFHKDIYRGYVLYLFLALAIAHAVTIEHAFVYRPDVVMMTLGFASFFLLHLSIIKPDIFKVLLAGSLAGTCVVTHLNGMVYVVAGASLLFYLRMHRLLFYFLLSSVAVSLIYFIEIQSKELLELYLFQFKNSPALSEKEFSVWGWVFKLITIYGPYFRHPAETSYALLFIFVMWTQRKKIWRNEDLKITFIYFSVIAVVLAVINPGDKTLYLIYHMPYAFILTSVLYQDGLKDSIKRRNWLYVLTIMYFLIQWGHTIELINQREPDIATANRLVAAKMKLKKGDAIIAPILFVFNEIDNYKIQCFNRYYMAASKGWIKFDAAMLFSEAKKDGRQVVIATRESMQELQLTHLQVGQNIHDFIYQGQIGPYFGFRLAGTDK